MTRDRQKARTATMVKSLCIEVVSTLDDYQSWANSASDAGRVTPVQFLAVVLWALSTLRGRDFSESEVNGVICKWWERLVEATVKRAATLGGHGPYRRLYPFDVLTHLELDQNKITTPQGWCIHTDDADEWLSSNGAGAWCAVFFESCKLRGRVEDLQQPMDKDSQLLDLLGAYERRGPALRSEFAKGRGLSESNLKKQLGQAMALRKGNAANPFAALVVVSGKKVAKK